MNHDLTNFNHNDEDERLENLYSYQILDTGIEQELDHLTQLAASICESPIALISLIDRDRQWFKSRYGLNFQETPRSMAFCHYTIQGNQILEIADAVLDHRFSNNPLVTGDPNIRHYAGSPLVTQEGFRLGSLCVIDRNPKTLTEAQKVSLSLLSQQVVKFFELKKKEILLEKQKKSLEAEIVTKDSELNAVNLELNTFIYKASHTLRGPVATIRGISEFGLRKFNNDEDLNLLFSMISKTGKELDKTISKLLEAVEIKNKPLEYAFTSIDDIKKDLLEIHKPYSEHIFIFSSNIQDNKVWVDRFLFLSILKNLVDNSIKYRKKERRLIVDVVFDKTDKHLLVSVKDNSEGIPIDVQKYLFNLHFRGNYKSKGAGLGLFLVYKAVLRLNGQIGFDSILDHGTEFKIQLPLLLE